MEITVLPSVNEARADELINKTVIVIDVLRATSTILTALAHGCKAIYPVETVLQAKQLYQPGFILGGERACKKIPGFDLGNSPLEYTEDVIAGKTLIMTTTNGTRAIQKANKASTIIAASLLNGKACAEEALSLKKDIVILCSGTQDVFALEDGLCAGQLIDEMLRLAGNGSAGFIMNDFGLSMLHAFRHVQSGILEALLQCANGKRLSKLGFIEDIHYCVQRDALSLVPVVREGKLVASSVSHHI